MGMLFSSPVVFIEDPAIDNSCENSFRSLWS